MTTIGSIGIGLFILIIIWIVTLIIFVLGVKFQNNIAWITLGSATALTILLLVIPTEKKNKAVIEEEILDKDYIIIYKATLLTFLIITALVGFLCFFVLHCIEPVRTKQIKNF